MNRHEAEIASLAAVESHVPERAEIFKAPSHPALRATFPREGGRKKSRPLLIFEKAEPTLVIASVPDGPPLRFTWRRVMRRVVKSQGPERIAPEWWRLVGGEAPRDYYMIEDEHGRRYWLYRDGLYGEGQPQWFVHGLSP